MLKPTEQAIAHGSALREREQYASDAAWRLRILGIITDDQQEVINLEINKFKQWEQDVCLYVLHQLPLKVVEFVKAQPNFESTMWCFPSVILMNSEGEGNTQKFHFRNNLLNFNFDVHYRPKSDKIYVDDFHFRFIEVPKYDHETKSPDEWIAICKEMLATFTSMKDLKKMIKDRTLPV